MKEAEELIKAWDALPGNRRYRSNEISNWLREHMQPAIQRLRDRLSHKVRVRPVNLLDLIHELNQVNEESLNICPEGLQIKFTLHRGNTFTEAVMPADHHCDIERIIDLVKFMKKRLDVQPEHFTDEEVKKAANYIKKTMDNVMDEHGNPKVDDKEPPTHFKGLY